MVDIDKSWEDLLEDVHGMMPGSADPELKVERTTPSIWTVSKGEGTAVFVEAVEDLAEGAAGDAEHESTPGLHLLAPFHEAGDGGLSFDVARRALEESASTIQLRIGWCASPASGKPALAAVVGLALADLDAPELAAAVDELAAQSARLSAAYSS